MAESTESLVAWIESETGAAVQRFGPHPSSGRSRTLWLVDVRYPDASSAHMLLRQDTGLGPFSGTTFTLGREAHTVRCLQGSPIPVPQIHGVSSGGESVLLELAAGDAELDLSDPLHRQALEHFTVVLARLHALDPAELALPIPIPTTPQDHALADLSAHRASYVSLCRPNPVADEAIAWLEDNAPDTVQRTSLLHGDAGPGNFLHRSAAVTALIDWEMTHVGDPMDDLAWLWFRTRMLRKDKELGHLYELYASESALALEFERINYFCVLVLFRCMVASAVRMAHHEDAATVSSAERTTAWLRAALNDQHMSGRVGASGDLPPLPQLAEPSRH
jgi:aminoglycoside phosphotransferase (APT) family kinase protein